MKCERCDEFSAGGFGTFFIECKHPVGEPWEVDNPRNIKALRRDKNPRLIWICADCMNCYDHPEDV